MAKAKDAAVAAQELPPVDDAEKSPATESAATGVSLQAPENIASVSIEGHEYPVNEHGLIEIALEHAHRISVALEHGFKQVGAAGRKLP